MTKILQGNCSREVKLIKYSVKMVNLMRWHFEMIEHHSANKCIESQRSPPQRERLRCVVFAVWHLFCSAVLITFTPCDSFVPPVIDREESTWSSHCVPDADRLQIDSDMKHTDSCDIMRFFSRVFLANLHL